MVKVAINGFGRIGRCLFRFLWKMPDIGGFSVLAVSVEGYGRAIRDTRSQRLVATRWIPQEHFLCYTSLLITSRRRSCSLGALCSTLVLSQTATRLEHVLLFQLSTYNHVNRVSIVLLGSPEVVLVNELVGGAETAAYLLKYDSIHGTW